MARHLEPSHWAWGYVAAFAAAATVGGLADWYAVIALFRRPLGLPIPHTAIIPRNHLRIADTLGSFIESNFLAPDPVEARLREVDFAALVAEWAFTDGGGATLWKLAVTGAPADGDLIQVDPTAVPSMSNGNALAMVALRDAAIVSGATVTDAWSSALGEVGVRVQGADGAARMSAAVASDAAARATSVSGVNLDEEAARLIQYQQSYQAAAKMLQVAQSVFDTLLEVTSR